MTPGTSEIFTQPKMAVWTHFHARHGAKSTPTLLPADFYLTFTSWSLLPSLVSLLSGGRVYPRNDKTGLKKLKKDMHQH